MKRRRFVYVGGNISDMMGVVSFRSFGQSVELTEEQARDLAHGGSPIVPAEEFDALGIDAEDVRKFGPFGALEYAPAEFQAKRVAAIAAYDKFRAAVTAVEGEG